MSKLDVCKRFVDVRDAIPEAMIIKVVVESVNVVRVV